MCLDLIEYFTVDAYQGRKSVRDIHIYYKLIDKPLKNKKNALADGRGNMKNIVCPFCTLILFNEWHDRCIEIDNSCSRGKSTKQGVTLRF